MPKRRRTEADDTEEEVQEPPKDIPPVKRSDIWLEDGNVVLQAEDTQFKVHRGLLARVSPIFADVFSVPQPAGGDLTVEGCPLLHLQDSAQDINHLLSALYDQRYHTGRSMPFEVAAALLRLGKKYEIEPLFDEVVCRLKVDLPTTLECSDSLPQPNIWREFCEEDNILRDIAEFAYTSNIPELRPILPITLAWCCIERLDSIILGEEEGDDINSKPLSPELQRVCLVGRQKMVDRFNEVFSWVDALGDSPECSTPGQCSGVCKTFTKSLWRPEPELDCMMEPWDRLVKFHAAKDRKYSVNLKKLCKHCYENAKVAYESTREECWDLLPSFFGLPGWDVLNKDSAGAGV